MSIHTMMSKVEDEKVLVIERVFDAPVELVFRMFKEPEHLKLWWGPQGWELPVCNIDFRPGGVWHYCMKCVEPGEYYGMESWGKAIYIAIDEPDLLMYTDYFSDAEGIENKELPATEITMHFINEDGRTRLVNRAEYISAEALKTVTDMGMLEGIAESWTRLDQLLKDIQQPK